MSTQEKDFPKHSPDRWIRILNHLYESNEHQTTKQIAKGVNGAITMVIRDMKELTDLGHVNRFAAPRHGYNYSFRSYKPTNTKLVELEKLDTLPEYVEVTLKDVRKLMGQWSDKPWRPKIYETSRNLPLSLARLYELAVGKGFGSVIQDSDVDALRSDINDFRQALMSTLRVVNGVLIADELWDINILASYLLTNSNPERINEIVQNVKKHN